MTITLDLTPDVEAYLREKAVREGRGTESIAQALLAQAMRWEAQERAEVIKGLHQGLEDSTAGRVTPLAAWDAKMRAKYNISQDVEPLSDAEADALP